MSFFQEDYLRVLTPITSNGLNPVFDDRGQMKFKESHLPISALRDLEKHNASLPQHLKMRIERVEIFANAFDAFPADKHFHKQQNGRQTDQQKPPRKYKKRATKKRTAKKKVEPEIQSND